MSEDLPREDYRNSDKEPLAKREHGKVRERTTTPDIETELEGDSSPLPTDLESSSEQPTLH